LLFIRRSRGFVFSLDNIRKLFSLVDRSPEFYAGVHAKVGQQLEQLRSVLKDLPVSIDCYRLLSMKTY